MKRTSRRRLMIVVGASALLLLAAIPGRQLYINRPGYGLPFYAQFEINMEDRWTGLGGTWEVIDGAMRNDSNDRGAKLLTGSPAWRDYIVESEVQALGAGSVGVLARVSEADLGEDSFKGYFAAVRAADNSLVLGAYDFAYHEVAKVPLPRPVRERTWYHVRLKVDHCQITASAWGDGMSTINTGTVNDPDCFRSGGIGLRSNGTGGVWRNLVALPVDSPVRAASHSAQSSSPSGSTAQRGRGQSATLRVVEQKLHDAEQTAPVQPIETLRSVSPIGSPVASVRGSVILTRPSIFVQDSTGGVEVQPENAIPLKIGDEVEVRGEVSLDRLSPMLRNATFRLLRESVPVSPVVVTANQVALGSYDGGYVQVEGYLRRTSLEKDGSVTMYLDAGTQSFHAILPPGRSRSHVEHIAPESRLRIRGVSVADVRFNKVADPFAILVRSAEEIEVAAGPPWWRPSTLIFMVLVGLALAFTLNYLYLVVKHWRLRAVAEERERLAHKIHDTLAQSFAGIGFQLQAIRNSIRGDSQTLERHVDLALLMARTSHEEARRSIASLRPESLGHMGLIPALREYAERMVKNGKVTVEASGDDNLRVVPPRIKDTLFRIGQEAIANSVRHAEPATIRINLQQQRSAVCLSVEDDGRGFIADNGHAGFGLLGMRKRAESISASLVIKSAPGSGTRVEVKAAIGPRFHSIAWLSRNWTH